MSSASPILGGVAWGPWPQGEPRLVQLVQLVQWYSRKAELIELMEQGPKSFTYMHKHVKYLNELSYVGELIEGVCDAPPPSTRCDAARDKTS